MSRWLVGNPNTQRPTCSDGAAMFRSAAIGTLYRGENPWIPRVSDPDDEPIPATIWSDDESTQMFTIPPKISRIWRFVKRISDAYDRHFGDLMAAAVAFYGLLSLIRRFGILHSSRAADFGPRVAWLLI